jgi:hypothetical protein
MLQIEGYLYDCNTYKYRLLGMFRFINKLVRLTAKNIPDLFDYYGQATFLLVRGRQEQKYLFELNILAF